VIVTDYRFPDLCFLRFRTDAGTRQSLTGTMKSPRGDHAVPNGDHEVPGHVLAVQSAMRRAQRARCEEFGARCKGPGASRLAVKPEFRNPPATGRYWPRPPFPAGGARASARFIFQKKQTAPIAQKNPSLILKQAA
jgi:hypothetical protein